MGISGANFEPRPGHEIAENYTLVPTVIDREMKFGENSIRSVFIQWFGDTNSVHMPKDAQFFFDTRRGIDDPIWVGNLCSFRVVFIGQAKDWPVPGALNQWYKDTNCGPETNIVWLMSPIGERPCELSSPMFPVVLLGDPVYGVIRPRLYCDMSVRDAVMKGMEDAMPLADRLARNYDLELPSEEIPWIDENWPECSCVEKFERSYDKHPAAPVHDPSFICQFCLRRWWQFNDHYHLWKHVTSKIEWDSIRRQQILKNAGYGLLDD